MSIILRHTYFFVWPAENQRKSLKSVSPTLLSRNILYCCRGHHINMTYFTKMCNCKLKKRLVCSFFCVVVWYTVRSFFSDSNAAAITNSNFVMSRGGLCCRRCVKFTRNSMVRSVLTYHEIFGSEGWGWRWNGRGLLLLDQDPQIKSSKKSGWWCTYPKDPDPSKKGWFEDPDVC